MPDYSTKAKRSFLISTLPLKKDSKGIHKEIVLVYMTQAGIEFVHFTEQGKRTFNAKSTNKTLELLETNIPSVRLNTIFQDIKNLVDFYLRDLTSYKTEGKKTSLELLKNGAPVLAEKIIPAWETGDFVKVFVLLKNMERLWDAKFIYHWEEARAKRENFPWDELISFLDN